MKKIFLVVFLTLALILTGVQAPVQAQGEISDCGDSYIVQPGDYLTKIANQCGVSFRALVGANPQITNLNIIYPGQVINMPGQDDGGDDVSIPVTGGSTYLAQPGDTIRSIADRFEVTVDELLAANPGLSQTQTINAGQQIRLPEGAARIPTISVTPITANPGTLVTIAATGFRANTQVLFGLGRVNAEMYQIGQATTNGNGAIYRTFRLPGWADANEQYVFVVQRQDDPSVRAVSNPIRLVGSPDTGIPVTGPDSYTVQAGDTLFEIAMRYDTTIEELLELNPTIENPARIYIGQRIILPDDARPVNPWVGVNDRFVVPGQQIRVRVLNFPANANVDVRLRPEGQSYESVIDARTDANGELLATIQVPNDAAVGGQWEAVVTTTERTNPTRALSRTFTIVGQ